VYPLLQTQVLALLHVPLPEFTQMLHGTKPIEQKKKRAKREVLAAGHVVRAFFFFFFSKKAV
jgi:hypothetical protein